MSITMRTSRAAVCGNRSFLGSRVPAPKAGSKILMRANWLPGSDMPAWLPEDLPGNYGFDPAGLAKNSENLKRFTEAELIHCRWAMLGVAGALGVEALGFGNWYDAPLWAVTGGRATYFGIDVPFDLNILLLVEFAAFAIVETQRQEAGWVAYPGGAFDPLGFAKDNSKIQKLKAQEIANGRTAMLAFLGFIAQHAATGKAPLAALGDHLASPFTTNFATNGVSVPFF